VVLGEREEVGGRYTLADGPVGVGGVDELKLLQRGATNDA